MGIFDRLKTVFQNEQDTGRPLTQRSLTNMRPDDIITIELTDYKVEGVTVYRTGMHSRYGYLLSDGQERRYLFVEEREDLRVYLFETLDARLENPEEVNNEMIFEDVSYFLKTQGEASVDVTGKSALNSYAPVYWWLHLADSGQAMYFEWQAGEILIRVGGPIKPYECKILAGSD